MCVNGYFFRKYGGPLTAGFWLGFFEAAGMANPKKSPYMRNFHKLGKVIIKGVTREMGPGHCGNSQSAA